MPTIAVLEGDETGQELLEEALRVLDPEVTGLDVSFDRATTSRSRTAARPRTRSCSRRRRRSASTASG